MSHLNLSPAALKELDSLAKWMDLFGFFYYLAAGMYALSGLFLASFGVLSTGGHFYLLTAMSLVMFVYCYIALSAGKNIFISSDNFGELARDSVNNTEKIIKGLESLKKFFILYGALITLSIVWIFFVL